MKAHVQNPWTQSPSLMVNLTVEETEQLKAGLEALKEAHIKDPTILDTNQENALNDLRMLLEQKLATHRPDGLKGAERGE